MPAVSIASASAISGHVDPRLYGIDFSFPPTNPTPGRCAVSANFLAGYPYGITYAGERVLGVRPGACRGSIVSVRSHASAGRSTSST